MSAASGAPVANESVATRLKAATAVLEEVAKNWSLLAPLSAEERTRLLTVAGEIYCPDVQERRWL